MFTYCYCYYYYYYYCPLLLCLGAQCPERFGFVVFVPFNFHTFILLCCLSFCNFNHTFRYKTIHIFPVFTDFLFCVSVPVSVTSKH